MWAEKCRRPCLYTRSKSACFRSRPLRGNFSPPRECFTAPGASPSPLAALVLTAHDPASRLDSRLFRREKNLLTKTGLHGNPLAPLGAPARDHRPAALGLHPRAKPVGLRTPPPVGLESALGHEKSCSCRRESLLDRGARKLCRKCRNRRKD